MAKRYIDADLIPYTDDDDYLSQYAYRYDIDEIPTADVVPRETVEQIFEEIYEDCFDQFGYIDYEALAELKKKYTGGQKG